MRDPHFYAMAPALTELPVEILEAIFFHLDPQSLLAVAQSCRRIKALTSDAPLIWRHFCQTHFKTWDSRHRMDAKFAGPLSNVDWRSVFIKRVRTERETLRLLNGVLGSQCNRTQNIDKIAEFGYDAKEALLREATCDEAGEDFLARRYYANAILQRIQREMVLDVWTDLGRGADVPLEKALAAFDMFTHAGENVEFETVAHDLDMLAAGLKQQYPAFDDLSARAKASTLAFFLRERGFRGVSDSSYRALHNSFIALVLRSETHDSLPLISVAIFCALARRVGLDARPCGFLYHVYCLIYAPENYTLDGIYKPTSSKDLDYIYLDPFRSSDEVLVEDLQRRLREMGVPPLQRNSYLSDSNTRDMVLRTARNIVASVQTIRQTDAGAFGINASWLNVTPDMDNAFYATIWAMLILGPDDEPVSMPHVLASSRRRQYLPYLLEHFSTHYPWDVSLLTQYVIPMFINLPEGERLISYVDSMRRMDGIPKSPKRRAGGTANSVAFCVGQLFRHKRYQYEGVVTGWDTACDAGEEWIHNMGVDRLSGGRNQAFYHVM